MDLDRLSFASQWLHEVLDCLQLKSAENYDRNIQYRGTRRQRNRANMSDLEAHRIQRLPPTAYYIPNFVSKAEEEYLLRKVSGVQPGFSR